MRRSGVALIADLVRMLEVCVSLCSALSLLRLLPTLFTQTVVFFKCGYEPHLCYCFRLFSPIFHGQRLPGHRLQSMAPAANGAVRIFRFRLIIQIFSN